MDGVPAGVHVAGMDGVPAGVHVAGMDDVPHQHVPRFTTINTSTYHALLPFTPSHHTGMQVAMLTPIAACAGAALHLLLSILLFRIVSLGSKLWDPSCGNWDLVYNPH